MMMKCQEVHVITTAPAAVCTSQTWYHTGNTVLDIHQCVCHQPAADTMNNLPVEILLI